MIRRWFLKQTGQVVSKLLMKNYFSNCNKHEYDLIRVNIFTRFINLHFYNQLIF